MSIRRALSCLLVLAGLVLAGAAAPAAGLATDEPTCVATPETAHAWDTVAGGTTGELSSQHCVTLGWVAQARSFADVDRPAGTCVAGAEVASDDGSLAKRASRDCSRHPTGATNPTEDGMRFSNPAVHAENLGASGSVGGLAGADADAHRTLETMLEADVSGTDARLLDLDRARYESTAYVPEDPNAFLDEPEAGSTVTLPDAEGAARYAGSQGDASVLDATAPTAQAPPASTTIAPASPTSASLQAPDDAPAPSQDNAPVAQQDVDARSSAPRREVSPTASQDEAPVRATTTARTRALDVEAHAHATTARADATAAPSQAPARPTLQGVAPSPVGVAHDDAIERPGAAPATRASSSTPFPEASDEAGPDRSISSPRRGGAAARDALATLQVAPLMLALIGATCLAALIATLYSRVRRDKVLDNDVRARLHALVREKPGVTEAEAARALSVHPTTVSYHVRFLKAHGHVAIVRAGKFRTLHPATGRAPDAQSAQQRVWETHAVKSRVLDALPPAQARSQKELAQALGMNRHTLAHHLQLLERAGLVLRERAGRETKYQRARPSDAS